MCSSTLHAFWTAAMLARALVWSLVWSQYSTVTLRVEVAFGVCRQCSALSPASLVHRWLKSNKWRDDELDVHGERCFFFVRMNGLSIALH